MRIIYNINKTVQTLPKAKTQSAEMPLMDSTEQQGKCCPVLLLMTLVCFSKLQGQTSAIKKHHY